MSTTAGVVYAGVPLPLVTGELEGYLRSFLDANTIEWFEPFIGGAKANCFSYAARQPKFELSKLIWPTDLSRFATALFVASATQLDQIHAAIDSGTPRAGAQLKIGEKKVSGVWEPIIDVEMYMLDPMQVTGTPKGTDALYLIPLVDKRYFLLKGSTETWNLVDQDTWTDWFVTAFNGLGLTSVAGDPIDEVYQKPGKLYYPQANTPLLPLIMDSAAFTVNRRILRKLDGTFHIISIDEAEALWDIVEGMRVTTGSRNKDMRMVLPETMSFSWYQGGTYDYDVAELYEWDENIKWRGVHAFTMRCNLAEGKTTEAGAFCERFTTDYLRWRIIRQDLTIPGIYRFAMTGAEDRVEFTVDATTALTRVFARHYDFIDSLSVRLDTIANTTCDTCTGGGGGGPELCPRVSNVTCTAGFMIVSYQLQCESVTEPVGQPPAGGPVGTIAMWSVGTIPDGWLECNGQQFDATVYPELFVALGGNNWNVPDLRDKFVRGHGATGKGSLRDSKPYKTGAPTNPFVAGAGGSHSHTNAPGTPIMVAPGTSGMTITGYTNTGTTSTAQAHTHTITGGDSETVPEHYILKFIIKART